MGARRAVMFLLLGSGLVAMAVYFGIGPSSSGPLSGAGATAANDGIGPGARLEAPAEADGVRELPVQLGSAFAGTVWLLSPNGKRESPNQGSAEFLFSGDDAAVPLTVEDGRFNGRSPPGCRTVEIASMMLDGRSVVSVYDQLPISPAEELLLLAHEPGDVILHILSRGTGEELQGVWVARFESSLGQVHHYRGPRLTPPQCESPIAMDGTMPSRVLVAGAEGYVPSIIRMPPSGGSLEVALQLAGELDVTVISEVALPEVRLRVSRIESPEWQPDLIDQSLGTAVTSTGGETVELAGVEPGEYRIELYRVGQFGALLYQQVVRVDAESTAVAVLDLRSEQETQGIPMVFLLSLPDPLHFLEEIVGTKLVATVRPVGAQSWLNGSTGTVRMSLDRATMLDDLHQSLRLEYRGGLLPGRYLVGLDGLGEVLEFNVEPGCGPVEVSVPQLAETRVTVCCPEIGDEVRRVLANLERSGFRARAQVRADQESGEYWVFSLPGSLTVRAMNKRTGVHTGELEVESGSNAMDIDVVKPHTVIIALEMEGDPYAMPLSWWDRAQFSLNGEDVEFLSMSPVEWDDVSRWASSMRIDLRQPGTYSLDFPTGDGLSIENPEFAVEGAKSHHSLELVVLDK